MNQQRTVTLAIFVASHALGVTQARADTVQQSPDAQPWRVTVLVGTTAIAANNVLPVPLAMGTGLLVERGRFGVEGAIHGDAATICDYNSSSDGYCGMLWIFDVAPRFTVAPDRSFTPYLGLRFQITSSRSHGIVPALGPRAGLRYRGSRLGAYLEGGPSYVSEANSQFGQFTSGRRWFPQVSAGMTFAIR